MMMLIGLMRAKFLYKIDSKITFCSCYVLSSIFEEIDHVRTYGYAHVAKLAATL